jgi:replicative DNA helicase
VKIQSKEIKLSGVPSGFTEIDRVTGGWKKGELIIIAARPSIGKSALAAQLALNAATFGENVAVFSLEMSSEEVARRYLSGATGMTNTQLLTGNCLSVEKLFEKTSKFVNLGIYIDDTGAMTLLEVKAKARRLILKYGIRLLIIDYLQLMRGTNTRNREQEVSELSRGLKSVAKELGIPVIVLSQLNRECEARANKKPILSDLRDSGAIEQDADIVLMLSRPAYYGNETININGKVIDTKGVMVVDIAKNRNGGTGDIFLKHNEALTVIADNIDVDITPF